MGYNDHYYTPNYIHAVDLGTQGRYTLEGMVFHVIQTGNWCPEKVALREYYDSTNFDHMYSTSVVSMIIIFYGELFQMYIKGLHFLNWLVGSKGSIQGRASIRDILCQHLHPVYINAIADPTYRVIQSLFYFGLLCTQEEPMWCGDCYT